MYVAFINPEKHKLLFHTGYPIAAKVLTVARVLGKPWGDIYDEVALDIGDLFSEYNIK